MPFKSKSQEKKCYATKGFGGKVDCKEWSSVTDHKNLPKEAPKSSSKKKVNKWKIVELL